MYFTIQGMEECLSKGLVKAIGISNFTITKIERLLKTAKTVPAVNQVESHPYFQQQKLKEYCDSKGKKGLFPLEIWRVGVTKQLLSFLIMVVYCYIFFRDCL